MDQSTKLRRIKPKRPPAVLICGKCLKTCDHGKSIRKALKSACADHERAMGRRPGKLVQTRCMGLCPKRAIVVASGAMLVKGELLLLQDAADAAAAVEMMFAGASA